MKRGGRNNSRAQKTTLTIPLLVKRAAFKHAAKNKISLSKWITLLLEKAMDGEPEAAL